MANTQALCSQFKTDLLSGWHSFSSTCPARTLNTADVFKAALYLATATVNATTTAYNATGEVTASGSYSAGGPAVTWITPAKTAGTAAHQSSTTYTTLSANIVITSFTATAFDAVLIYNSTNNKAVSVHTFGSQSIVAGTFTLTMPTNNQTTGLIRLN